MAELAGFFAMERALRKDHQAATMRTGKWDQGSTVAIGATFGFALLAAPAGAFSKRGRLPIRHGWLGIGVMAAAIVVRAWAASTLGASYTRTLQVRDDQGVIDRGPYAYVRHPGYAADILMWFGYGLAWGNTTSVLATTAPTIPAYLYRIKVEEAMLTNQLGADYRNYAARTSRLIPGVY
jgi:protein-S-isoprenylcysteine O-methyltransferase Ste14